MISQPTLVIFAPLDEEVESGCGKVGHAHHGVALLLVVFEELVDGCGLPGDVLLLYDHLLSIGADEVDDGGHF